MNLALVDFALPPAMAAALAAALLFPPCLAAMSRIGPLAGRHGSAFLASSLIMIVCWLAIVHWPGFPAFTLAEALGGLFVVLGAVIFYLQLWGLMTRGFSLGILLTLLKTGRPLTGEEIFVAYRDGDGLGWIMRHRLDGLCAAGMIVQDGDRLVLSSPTGTAIAMLNKACVAFFGLRRTG
jgi:hypothetical protein